MFHVVRQQSKGGLKEHLYNQLLSASACHCVAVLLSVVFTLSSSVKQIGRSSSVRFLHVSGVKNIHSSNPLWSGCCSIVSWIGAGRWIAVWAHGDALLLTKCFNNGSSRGLKHFPGKPHSPVCWIPSKVLDLLEEHKIKYIKKKKKTWAAQIRAHEDTFNNNNDLHIPVSPVPPLNPKRSDVWSKWRRYFFSRTHNKKYGERTTVAKLLTRLWSSWVLCSRTGLMLG